jgi:hypothetical protein
MAAEALHPALIHHIVNTLGWPALRPLQEEAVAPILRGEEPRLVSYASWPGRAVGLWHAWWRPARTGTYFLRVLPSSSASSGTYSICVYDSATPGCRTNVLQNPSFETDANADGRPDSWTSSSKFTRSNAIAPRAGRYVGRLSATVNIPATSDAFTLQLRVRWRNALNGTISVTTIGTFAARTMHRSRSRRPVWARRSTSTISR